MFNIFKKIKTEEQKENQSPKQQESIVETQNIENENDNQEKISDELFSVSISGLKQAISKTSESLVGTIMSSIKGKSEIDDDLLDEIEETLIKADLGLDTTLEIVNKLREKKNSISVEEVGDLLKDEFIKILNTSSLSTLNLCDNQLNIMLIVGVNGAGKTTLIGKLAYRFKMQGKKVMVAAGDTFRAAAEDQLEIWTNRAGAEIVRNDGADPASVVHDAIRKAKENNTDILLIDTAGRLQNKFNLMEELKKIKKVIDKEASGLLAESMLVLDATTGQNGLQQAEVFKEAVQLTSVALTKLDGSAKGGIIIAIAKELNIPVKLIGIGEKMEDLKDFNPNNFIEALF